MNMALKKQSLLFILISLFLFALIPACSKDRSDRAETKQHEVEGKAEKGIVKEPQAKVSTTLEETEEQGAIQEEKNTPPVIKDARLILDVEDDKPVLRAEVQADDQDGDDVEIQYQWYKNGEEAGEGESFHDFKRGDKIFVKLRVFDGKDYSRERRLSIDIINTPPKVVNDKKFTFDGKTYVKKIIASDPDGDALTYKLIKGPESATLNEQSGVFQWNVPEDFKGNFPVEVSVEDGHGGRTLYKFDITIKEEPIPNKKG